MMNADTSAPEVADALSNTNSRHSAATIEHTEVHIDLSKNSPVINTGTQNGSPSVNYANTESGQATIVVQTKPDPHDKPKDFVVTSCFVIMFCNFCWGIAGWHYGLKANNAWQLGDEVECRTQARRAKILVICGVITGIVTWVLSLTLFFTLSPFRPGV